jgi:uncharacterized protein YdeI (YjbR/CyaY-like superfamily)
MAMKASITTVDGCIAAKPGHAEALSKLRRAVHRAPLEETIKWGAPCYTLNGKNIVGLAAFKAYVGLWFHQGALLSDPDGVLINAGEAKTKALRQWRFETAKDIRVRAVQAYVREAIALAEAGKEITPDRARPVVVPSEFEAAMARDRALKTAFEALTPGKRRDYADHINEAKREATKQSRLAKIIPMIKAGGGLHDKYRNC